MATLFRRSNGVYYCVISVKGKRIWRSTHCTSREEAEKVAQEISSEVLPPKHSKPTVNQFRALFLPYARTNLAPNTVLLYEGAISAFVRLLGDKRMDRYTVFDIERFKSLRLEDKVSPAKVNMDFRSLKAFFQVAVKWGTIAKNPFTEVSQLRIPQMRPKFLSKDEFAKLMEAIPHEWFRNLVVFAVLTMMRLGEIVNLTWESIDLERRVIHVENRADFRVKTRRPRAIPMNDWVFRFLTDRPTKSGFVFLFPDGRKLNIHYVSKKFKKSVKSSGIPQDLHFHSLRHTGASWLVQNGVSIYAVQRLLGHSNIQVTMGYSHLVTDELHSVVNSISVSPVPCQTGVLFHHAAGER